MANGIIGFCRFSFLGIGDWIAYRNLRGGAPLTDEALQGIANKLYDPKRLELRFWLFENLLLRSIVAQRDKDFTLIVLTSPEMPQPWLDRLHAMVAGIPTVRVVVSTARSCKAALLPELEIFRSERKGGGYPIQFRIDDDDCLSTDYIRALRKATRTMEGVSSYAVSMPQALVMAAYGGTPITYYRLYSMFHSAGCAYYTEDETRTVFHYAHTLFHKRVASLVLPTSTSAFMTKFDGHDADGLFLRNQRKDLEKVEGAPLDTLIAKRFPFLEGLDYEPVRRMAADQAA